MGATRRDLTPKRGLVQLRAYSRPLTDFVKRLTIGSRGNVRGAIMTTHEQPAVPKRISVRKLTVLGLLRCGSALKPKPIHGVTRMQKLVFLVQARIADSLKGTKDFNFDFAPEPHNYGPADIELYQDLDFLEAMRLIRVNGRDRPIVPNAPSFEALMQLTIGGEPSLPEEEEEEELSFDYLMGKEPEEFYAAEAEDSETETSYEITSAGSTLLDRIESSLDLTQRDRFSELMTACEQVQSEYGDLPLKTLLRHVYQNFPTFIGNSLIRGEVLGHGTS